MGDYSPYVANQYFPIQPSDTAHYSSELRGIYVGTGGDITILRRQGATQLFKNVPAGRFLPVVCYGVKATGTTASNLVGEGISEALETESGADTFTVFDKPLDTGLPWNVISVEAVHNLSVSEVDFLWNWGSDRVGNINMLSSYACFMRVDATDSYTVTSTYGSLNGQVIPWNPLWKAYHSDGQIIVLDTDGSSTWEFFGTVVNVPGKTITATRADYFNADTGAFSHPNSRGIGIPYVHFLITEQEILNGVIPHVLSIRIANPRCNEAWYPAQKIENHPDCSLVGNAEGQKFKCTFTQTEIDNWATGLIAVGGAALSNFGRMVATALQTYGFYVTDNGGLVAGIDMQNINTMEVAPIRLVNPTAIQNMLDGLLSQSSFSLLSETGPRRYTYAMPTVGILEWWCADDIGTANITSDISGLISSWLGRVNGTQLISSGTAKPVIGVQAFDSTIYGPRKSGVAFDGIDDVLTGTVFPAIPIGAVESELWVVVDANGPTGVTAGIVAYGGTSAGNSRQLTRSSGTPARVGVNNNATFVQDTLYTFNSRQIATGIFEATPLMTANLDNLATSINSTPAAALNTGSTRFRLGANMSGTPTNFLNGVIRHVFITNILTSAQRTALARWAGSDSDIVIA
jgi:hypothetical protein